MIFILLVIMANTINLQIGEGSSVKYILTSLII